MKLSSCVTDVGGGGGGRGYLSWHRVNTTIPHSRPHIWVSSDCERNLTRAQRASQAKHHSRPSRPCDVTNEAPPSHQQVTQSHARRSVARSSF